MKPYAESCDENRDPILSVLREVFVDRHQVLELGSGTGQHAVYFARHLPHLVWQCSDVSANHAGINAWLNDEGPDNAQAPLDLDVLHDRWPSAGYDAVFSANTAHIMGWDGVEAMFTGVGALLPSGGRFALYGPFNYGGEYTSPSNERFDSWLKGRDPASGIRDFEALCELAGRHGMRLLHDYEMPVNNRLLVWEKS